MIRIAAGVALTLAGALALAAPTRWDFDVLLDGKPIGYHRFALDGNAAGRAMKIEARFTVKFLGITAYRYAHDAEERWRGNCLDGLSARTDDDGEKFAVDAGHRGDTLTVTTATARTALDGCVMTFAYWNPEILRETRLLNAQTGQYENVKIAALGEEIVTVRGSAMAARHLRITGPRNPIDLWYSADDAWVALESTVAGGRRLRYQLK